MEAEVLDAEFVHDFKTSVHLVLCTLHGIVCLIPLVGAGLSAKLVSTGTTQCVPPSHGELQPFFHFLAHHDLLGVIIVESHYVLTFLSFERNLTGKRKILFCHSCSKL